jgi:aminocarboxymuconate-semialdehyde decarboxylase
MIVDVHVHIAPPEFLAALEASGSEVVHGPDGAVVRTGELKLQLPPEFLSPEAFVGRLDRIGVDVGVVSIATLLVDYTSPNDVAERVAMAANIGMANFVKAAPQRLRWLAHVPMQDIPAACRILEQAMAAGALGAQIGTHVNGRNLDEPYFKPFFEKASALGAFFLVHSVDCMAAHRLSRHYATNIIGNPYESGLAVASVIFGQVREQAPNMHLCFCHGGGAAPALAARWDRAWSIDRLDGTKLSVAPSQAFKSLWFDSLCYGPEQLRLLVSLAGTDRVLLGSDNPFPIAHPDPVGAIRSIDWLSDAEKNGILGANAQKLLRIR